MGFFVFFGDSGVHLLEFLASKVFKIVFLVPNKTHKINFDKSHFSPTPRKFFITLCECVGVVCVVNVCTPKFFPIIVVWYFWFPSFFFEVQKNCGRFLDSYWMFLFFVKLLFTNFESMISSVQWFIFVHFFFFLSWYGQFLLHL